jgi:hypothetical protein
MIMLEHQALAPPIAGTHMVNESKAGRIPKD